jgi:hypothetical protein
LTLLQKCIFFDLNNPNADKDWLASLSKFAGGVYGYCRKLLKVKKYKENFQGRKFIFECGHTYALMKVDDKFTTQRDDRRTYTKTHIELKHGIPTTTVELTGNTISGESEEQSIARLFIQKAYPEFTKIEKNTEQSSITDVYARTPDVKS